MKKVLIAAYYFPPCGGVASFRAAKFVKYLKKFGWEPVVLTVEPEYYPNIDEELLKDNISEDIQIIRTKLTLKKLLKNPGICWIFPLMAQIKKLVKEQKIDAIFMTGDPWFQFVTAAWAKKKLNIPYILDFRDEWSINVYRGNNNFKDKLKTFIAGIIEKFVLKRAIKAIVVNDEMKELYENHYGNSDDIKGKFVTIPNGYDSEDYKDIAPKKYDGFSIVYTGKFMGFRSPEIFLKAFEKLAANADNIRLIHVGNVENSLVDAINKMDIAKNVELIGFKTYKESLSYAKGADILLLIGGDSKIEQTAKVFDYIGCGRPILALAREDGSAADIIRKTGCGMVFENRIENIDRIVEYVKEAINNKKISYDPKETFEKYLPEHDRVNLTKKLAEVFDQTLQKGES